MTRTIDQVTAWAQSHPSPHQGGSWSELCEQFINNAGDFAQAFPSAADDRAAAQASGVFFTPGQLAIDDVPAGWLLFWDYNPYGHVAFKVDGGRALMASNYVTTALAPALGYIRAADYTAASGHAYLGASPYHGTETLQGVQMSLLTPSDITAIAQGVWTQAIKNSVDGSAHQAQSYLVWGWQDARTACIDLDALAKTIQGAAPAVAAGVSHQDLVAALTDPTVQAAIAASLAKHLPTKITGTLGV